MLENIKKLFAESDLLFRVWITAVFIIFISLGFSEKTLEGIAIGVIILAVFSYIILKIIAWVIDGLKQIEKNSLLERIALISFITILFLAIYYLISPLQICRRSYPYQDKSFCIQHAKW